VFEKGLNLSGSRETEIYKGLDTFLYEKCKKKGLNLRAANPSERCGNTLWMITDLTVGSDDTHHPRRVVCTNTLWKDNGGLDTSSYKKCIEKGLNLWGSRETEIYKRDLIHPYMKSVKIKDLTLGPPTRRNAVFSQLLFPDDTPFRRWRELNTFFRRASPVDSV